MAMGVQGKMIEAAARAGVKWILPTEYAGDGLNEGMVEAVPLFHPKREARRQIEELSKEKECEWVKWIGIATGPGPARPIRSTPAAAARPARR